MLRNRVTGQYTRRPIKNRFWDHVKKDESDKCWEWTGGKTPKGYGMIWVGNNNKGAHRVSWELHYGEIPEGMCVCHHCDNTWCINPNHLFLGTYADNNKDKVKKGRQSVGERSGVAKVTVEDILEIRFLYATGEYTQQEIADQFNVKRRQISQIVRREAWKHI